MFCLFRLIRRHNAMRLSFTFLLLGGLLMLPHAEAYAQSTLLGGAFTIQEIDQDDKPVAKSRGYIDVNNALVLSPNQAKLDSLVQVLTQEIAAEADSAAAATRARQRRLIIDLLEDVERQMKLAERLLQLNIELQTVQDSVVREAFIDQIIDEGRKFDAIDNNRIDQLEEYFGNERLSEEEGGIRVDNLLEQGAKGVRNFLNDELEKIDGGMQQDADDILASANSATVTIRAFVVRPSGGRIPVHVPGYDELEEGIPRKIDKVSTQLLGEQKERMDEMFQANTRIAGLLRGIQQDRSFLSDKLGSLREQLGAKIEGLRATLSDFDRQGLSPVERAFDEIKGLVAPLAADSNVGFDFTRLTNSLDTLRTTLNDTRRATSELLSVVDEVRATKRALPQNLAGANPVEALGTLVKTVNGVAEVVTTRLGTLTHDVTRIGQVLTDLNGQALELAQHLGSAEPVASRIRTAATDLAGQPVVRFLALIRASKDEAFGVLGKRFEEDASTISDAMEISDGLAPEDVQLIRRPLNEVQPTKLDLLTLDRREGDKISVTIQVSQDERVLREETALYEVKKLGIVSGVSGGVAFITSDNDSLDVRFEPTAMASYVFTLQTRGDINWIGLGIHTTPLNFDTAASAEMGVGVSLHLYNDFFQIGVGKNLHAADEPTYWFFGLGVYDLLQSGGIF